jgi:hypothetical protein
MTSQGDVIDDTCSEVCSIEISLEQALTNPVNSSYSRKMSVGTFGHRECRYFGAAWAPPLNLLYE